MHVQTHILSGWCVANLVPGFTARERLLGMLAASLADLDGISRLFGEEAYWDYHHKLGHCLAYGLLLSGVLTVFARPPRRLLTFVVCLALFHLHLVMDYYGSGPGWGIAYGWPFSQAEWRNADAWPFFSWQNVTGFVVVLFWTLWIARRQARTPLEAMMPGLDHRFVRFMGRGPRPAADAVPPPTDP